MDVRAQQAKEHHRAGAASDQDAARHRSERDRLVRLLRTEDPQAWTYPQLAAAVGCSPELIAYILKRAPGRTS